MTPKRSQRVEADPGRRTASGYQIAGSSVGAAEELLPELAMIAKERPDALFVYPDVVLSSFPRPQQLADFAIKAHLPTMHAFRFFVDAGGLMSYGATQSEIYTMAAEQVAKNPGWRSAE
jgi:ABC-type uncharacterized transport system substrate-binding protein